MRVFLNYTESVMYVFKHFQQDINYTSDLAKLIGEKPIALRRAITALRMEFFPAPQTTREMLDQAIKELDRSELAKKSSDVMYNNDIEALWKKAKCLTFNNDPDKTAYIQWFEAKREGIDWSYKNSQSRREGAETSLLKQIETLSKKLAIEQAKEEQGLEKREFLLSHNECENYLHTMYHWIRHQFDANPPDVPENFVSRAVVALRRKFGLNDYSDVENGKNPWEKSVEEQIASLRRANEKEGWGITEEDFIRLLTTAPAWPIGRSNFRSFRIRFGTGDAGVIETFKAHLECIKHVHSAKNFSTFENPKLDSEHLRLSLGNNTHIPCIEWCLMESNIEGDEASDEKLVWLWLFPEWADYRINQKRIGDLILGYDISHSDFQKAKWQFKPAFVFSPFLNQILFTSSLPDELEVGEASS